MKKEHDLDNIKKASNIVSSDELKQKINFLIFGAVKEIFLKRKRYIAKEDLKNYRKELDLFFSALKSKNKIYDYAFVLDFNDFNSLVLEIAYSLFKDDDNLLNSHEYLLLEMN